MAGQHHQQKRHAGARRGGYPPPAIAGGFAPLTRPRPPPAVRPPRAAPWRSADRARRRPGRPAVVAAGSERGPPDPPPGVISSTPEPLRDGEGRAAWAQAADGRGARGIAEFAPGRRRRRPRPRVAPRAGRSRCGAPRGRCRPRTAPRGALPRRPRRPGATCARRPRPSSRVRRGDVDRQRTALRFVGHVEGDHHRQAHVQHLQHDVQAARQVAGVDDGDDHVEVAREEELPGQALVF